MPNINQAKLIVRPEEFFREKVHDAIAAHNFQIDQEVEFYIVSLLCNFIAPETIETDDGHIDLMNTPLALILKHAIDGSPQKRLRIFRALGDTSLYLGGFFQDHLNDKTYDISYVMTLGVTAYRQVSDLSRDRNPSLAATCEQLVSDFETCVEILAAVSDATEMPDAKNLLATYERWMRTPTDRLRKKLMDSGITPTDSTRTRQ